MEVAKEYEPDPDARFATSGVLFVALNEAGHKAMTQGLLGMKWNPPETKFSTLPACELID